MRGFLLAITVALQASMALAQGALSEKAKVALIDQGKLDVTDLQYVQDSHGELHGLGLRHKSGVRFGAEYLSPAIKLRAADTKLDLDAKGCLSPNDPVGQGQCGSCWGWSIMRTLESVIMCHGNPFVKLSRQEVVSCDKQAWGCNGGTMDDLGYVVPGNSRSRGGVSTWADYPYTSGNGVTGQCKQTLPPVAAHASRFVYIGKTGQAPTKEEVKQALNDYGVLSTVVAAGGTDWSNGGTMRGCRTRGQNHMVNVYGYDADDFLGTNSWGLNWGDKGNFRATLGCNQWMSGSESVGALVYDGPVAPPHAKLPSKISVLPDTTFPIGVKAEPGVTYSWTLDKVALPDTDSVIMVSTPAKNAVYKIAAKNGLGTVESSVKIQLVPPPSFN